MSFAIYYVPEAYTLKGKVMGRQSAGLAFLRAVANQRFGKVWCYSKAEADAKTCAQDIATLGSPRTGVAWIPFSDNRRLSEAGLLYRPDPGIEQEAWRRLATGQSDRYSLCGITHTTASHTVMEMLARLPLAPIESWDAVICTSHVVRDSTRKIIEAQIDFLRERVGATRFSLPQLPVIPLGVHCADFQFKDEFKRAARAAIGLADDEVAVLFAGRLSYHGKAHPLPMYLALEASARDKKVVLIEAGWFATDAIEGAFKSDAETLCPSVRKVYVDGRDQRRLKEAFAGADIFCSLSDNIQETFGLTPLEAMAAGLPVVVTDWNGYRDTVRHKVDGFRIPTLTLPSGKGAQLADHYDIGLAPYDLYTGYASQLVSVDIEATTDAFRKLISDKDLRLKMGKAGAERAREKFDWTIIFNSYTRLWEELAERRRADPRLNSNMSARRRPDRMDPFSMFEAYPTYHIGSDDLFRVRNAIRPSEALERKNLSTLKFAVAVMPPNELISSIVQLVGNKWVNAARITSSITKISPDQLMIALVWLTKIGVLEHRPKDRKF